MKVWPAHVEHVGAMKVLRALPHEQAEAVGPFVFLDHFGPFAAKPGTLPAHPHGGIEVLTYLMAGSNEHRDSAGHIGRVQAGGAQYMRAGQGILHSERILGDAPIQHGLQLWARLPIAMQDDAPSYRGIAASEIPTWTSGGVTYRLLADHWQGRAGPITLGLIAFILHVSLQPRSSVTIDLPDAAHEYGVYTIESPDDGAQLADNTRLRRGELAMLAVHDTTFALSHSGTASGPAEMFVLGGEAAPRPPVFGGPFVFESRDALQRANQRYAAGQMGTLDGVPF